MKALSIIYPVILGSCIATSYANNQISVQCTQLDARIAMVGAGPAAIAALGVMLDAGVPPAEIIWIDGKEENDSNAFHVGALGSCFSNVPGNSKANLYVKFLQSCAAFRECRDEHFAALEAIDPEFECDLIHIVRPLQTITNHLRRKIRSYAGNLQNLSFVDNHWVLKMPCKEFTAHTVVLATGSQPKKLEYQGLTVIPLEAALDRQQLSSLVTANDTIALFGSAHSAILILKYLSELGVSKIINFYTKPISFPQDHGTWIQNQASGLKGATARWAQEVLLQNPPACIERYQATKENIEQQLPRCTKVIYAIGFMQNPVNGVTQPDGTIPYDDVNGTIGPRLFGIGIGFPHKFVDPHGAVEHRIGLTTFMEHALKVVPYWLQTRSIDHLIASHRLKEFEELFAITLL
ncbi:hypothetical protein M1466_00610 [Candidatus Dependentiae bacterium]|nr:hypothetical protein [Candidatus Dependentiae bacterium]